MGSELGTNIALFATTITGITHSRARNTSYFTSRGQAYASIQMRATSSPILALRFGVPWRVHVSTGLMHTSCASHTARKFDRGARVDGAGDKTKSAAPELFAAASGARPGTRVRVLYLLASSPKEQSDSVLCSRWRP